MNNKNKQSIQFCENDPEKLAGKIKQIMNLPEEERKEIGKANREYVVENHSLDNLAKKIVDAFK